MSDAGPVKPEDEREDLEVLRAKYHDYCSAQLADLLLYLSPDEIYLLAERASRQDAGALEDPGYARMVRMATSWLAERVALPPFEVWLEDYQAHPEHYEEYFLGLWERDVGVAPEVH